MHKNKGLEEERRLAYVAITRARKKIYITYVNQNRYSYASHDYNLPSRFINELPSDFTEINDSKYIQENNFLQEFIESNDFSNDIITPGRQRLINNLNKKEIDWDINQDQSYNIENAIGKRVFHQKFGNGKILELDLDKAIVKFENFTTKKIYLKFLKFFD